MKRSTAEIPNFIFDLPPATQDTLAELAQQFELSDDKLISITRQFAEEFRAGLSRYNEAMAMIPTFVTGVPNGTEKGTFLALDLGGTNLRVCEVNLHGDKTFTIKQQKYRVSEILKTGEASVLFGASNVDCIGEMKNLRPSADYLADSVDAFLTESGSEVSEQEAMHLGLTFSFPVEQTALNRGKILTWTKGFSARNAIGNDVVQLLQDAFDRKHIHVKCTALVNDTVGALLSRAYTSGGCLLGAIFGTGTNGAYVEDIANLTKLGNSDAAAAGGKMIVNTEWGAFNNTRTHLPSTRFDNALDRMSINPRFQAFEKFISGMYLGEVARHIMLYLVDSAPPILFGGNSTVILNTHYGFDSAYMSEIEGADSTDSIRKVIVERLGFPGIDAVSASDAEIVRWVCQLVATRAAKLSGSAVAAVLVQTRNARLGGGSVPAKADAEVGGRLAVGVDGSLVQFYPRFEERMRDALKVLVGEDVEKRVEIGMAKDGSGVGAALCALQAAKQMNEI